MTANCGAGFQRTLGPYRYTNDQWGSNKETSAFEQCLLERRTAHGSELGWSWHWPGFDETVFAYPSITFGWKPWSGGTTTDPHLPARVGAVKELVLDYEVETHADGAYNLAAEMWFTSSGPSDAANPKAITHEVMLWLEYRGDAIPAGRRVATPRLDGVPYELWKEDRIGVEANGVGWTLISFKAPAVQRRGTLPLHELLRELIARSLLSPDEYVASVEFGNEVMGGRGTTWVKRLQMRVSL